MRVLTVEQLFTTLRFELPWFQRAYAWSEQHAGRLISDLVRAASASGQGYWLGHVFLATPAGQDRFGLIDGHQRAVTLTMLCALLRDMADDGPVKARLHRLIADDSGVRLNPQPGVSRFFHDHVQAPGSTLRDPQGDLLDLSEGERHLLNNRDHLRRMIRQLATDDGKRSDLAKFVLDRCIATVESVVDEDVAWSLLATAEETGLEFHSSARAKVSLITAIPREEHEEASHLFEQALNAVGADGMTSLLSHIRTLKVRRRSSKPVEGELLTRFRLNKSGKSFMRDELVPRAEAMARVNRRAIGSGDRLTANARVLTTLFWIDHQLWMPPVLHWMSTMGDDHPETPTFLARIERLTFMLKIGGVDPTVQERRFILVLKDIDDRMPAERMRNLMIEPGLRDAALDGLRSRTFYFKRFQALVLRRIAWNLSPERDPGPVDGKNVTVEHVLPRKPEPNRRWWSDFPTEDIIRDHCNLLGNLAFLSLHDNQRAGTNDFILKRFLLANAAGTFVLAEQASKFDVWTPETITQRTEALIDALLRPWGVQP